MELQVVVEAFLGQLHKIAHMDGGIVASELHADIALGGFDYGHFVAVGLIFRCVQSHGFP